jgi:hypothetical protein
MSAGYPARVTRSDFGPQHVDEYPVENPETQRPASSGNLMAWQVAGMNGIVPRVSLEATWNGSSFDVQHQREAWNPENDVAHPALARVSAGRYTYTLLASYLDADGNTVATVVRKPRLSVNKVLTAFADRISANAWIDPADPLVVEMRIWEEATGTAVDLPFWLEVL